MTQSIIRGQSPRQVIAEIAERFNVSKSRAGALVMTESAFFASAARRDAFVALDVEQYAVLATLDSHTSPICRSMDGKVMPMSEYKPGMTAPPFHVYCRSTTVPYFDDEFTVGEQRAARGKDGEYYTVPADMKYEEWKKTFVDGGSKDGLKKSSNSDKIYTGAIAGALNPNTKAAYKHAKTFYDEVRKRRTDYKTIAERTGLSEAYVKEVKDHLFMRKHDLGKGTPEYFYPDYEIAQSWQRLTDANMEIQKHDLILLHHEYLEAEYMKNGLSQQQAHEKAEAKFDYAKALKERG